MNKRLAIFSLVLCLFLVSLFAGGQKNSSAFDGPPPTYSAGTVLNVYFFYGTGCPHCAKVEPFIVQMEKKYPLNVSRFDIYTDRNLLAVFEEYSNQYGLPSGDRGVPAIFVANVHFVGDWPILEGFEKTIVDTLKANQTATIPLKVTEISTKTLLPVGGFSLLTITVTALIDSISPCSIAILVFLIGARVLVGSHRKRALRVGLSFCLAVFIAYLAFGFGLFTVVQVSGYSSLFSLLVGAIAVLAGVLYFKDVFAYGWGGFVMEVPQSAKPLLMRLLKGVTSPFGAFLMGFAVASFELPCTGGPYLFILGQLANNATRMQAVPLLLYYNLIFILPLVMISLVLYSNLLSIGKARDWAEANKRLLKGIGGFGMMVMGVSVLPAEQTLSAVQMFLRGFRTVGPLLLTFLLVYAMIPLAKQKLGGRLLRLPRQGITLILVLVGAVFAASVSPATKNIRADAHDVKTNVVDCVPDNPCTSDSDCGTSSICGYCSGNKCVCEDTTRICNTGYLCSDTWGGDDMYGAGDQLRPSKGYCDGSGHCDWSKLFSAACSQFNRWGQEGATVTYCVDGQSNCVDTCADHCDNDNNGYTDCKDSQCSSYPACAMHAITFDQSGVGLDFAGTVVTIDGANYKRSDLPASFTWQIGTSHTFAYQSPLAGSGTQNVWTSTSGLSTLQKDTITVTANGSVTGNYKTQYYLTVTSQRDSPTPSSGWFDSGSEVTASVSSPVSGGSSTQYVCTGWTGIGSVPASGSGTTTTFTIAQASSITWNWKTQYQVTFSQTGVSSDYAGTVATIDSANYPVGSLPSQFWWDNGSAHTFTFISPLIVNADKQYNWVSTTGLSVLRSDTMIIAASGSVTGNYASQTSYQVTFSETGVSSDFTGTVLTVDGSNYKVTDMPVSFLWGSGSAHTFSYESPLTVTANERQYVWTSTSGLSSLRTGILTVTSSGGVTGNYKTQYLLTVSTSPSGLNPEPSRIPTGEAAQADSWWYDSSTTVTLTAATVADASFDRWSVDNVSQGQGVNPITVAMNSAHAAIAYYSSSGVVHDVAVTGVNLYRTIVSNKTMTTINVTVANQGDVQETFTMIASYNATVFASQMITVAANGSFLSTVKWLLLWNTSGISLGNYNVTVAIAPLPGETDTDDNSNSALVQVSILGDINGDGRVDMKDVSKVAAGFQTRPGDTKWAANGDLDENGVLDMKDISTIAKHFGEHYS